MSAPLDFVFQAIRELMTRPSAPSDSDWRRCEGDTSESKAHGGAKDGDPLLCKRINLRLVVLVNLESF